MPQEMVTFQIQMFDRTKKARVTCPRSRLVSDLLSECKTKWTLPADVDHGVRDVKRSLELNGKDTLEKAGVTADALLEVFPLHEAGRG